MLLEGLLMPIRYVGLSNETPYGVMKFLQLAKDVGHYRNIVSVQPTLQKFQLWIG